MRTRLSIAVLLAAGCAGRAAPMHFPARSAPAATTTQDDQALLAAGYVSLGPVKVVVEKERCRGTDQAPGACEKVATAGPSRALLLAKAAERGGDLVRIASEETPATDPWIEIDCDAVGPIHFSPPGGPLPPVVIMEEAVCAKKERVVGTRHLAVSAGTIWRRAPELVPNMLLLAAIANGDEARVAALLPRVSSLDAYLQDPPLVVATRTGNAAIVRRLLEAGARAGGEAALLEAVARADEGVTRQLLAAGVSPDVTDPRTAERPLHVASRRRASPALLHLLLDAGADVNALDAADQMPLQAALLSCDVATATILIEAGASRSWARADATSLELARATCPRETAAIVARLSGK
jgi:hypothetical protein